MPDRPVFFSTPAEFRAWLEEHHQTASELLVGFYKKGSGKPSMTWTESVDQALCFGWIDSVRKSLGPDSYMNRFTPRTSRSNWSAVNIKRARELIDLGLMRPAGLRAFEQLADERSAVYSYEQRKSPSLDPALERRFRSNRQAWDFFQAQAPSYRRAAIWWVTSAKRDETKDRRLTQLIEDSAAGRRVPPLTSPSQRPT
jgi:uncharacterized protein YdeI (YjbR/CyaY-like superfamily)